MATNLVADVLINENVGQVNVHMGFVLDYEIDITCSVVTTARLLEQPPTGREVALSPRLSGMRLERRSRLLDPLAPG